MGQSTEQVLSDQKARLEHKVQRLEQLLARYKHTKSIQSALLQLSELANSVTDMEVFYAAMHGVIGQLLLAENFYVVLVDPQTEQFTPVYFSDQEDDDNVEHIDSEFFKTGLTGYVYRTRKTLVCDQTRLNDMLMSGDIAVNGAIPTHWMGCPLIRGCKAFGVVAVQIYGDGYYTETEQELLEFITLHLVTAIDRIKQRELLEQSVRRRTQELSEVNQDLQKQIQHRERAENLQAALFKISQITATSVLMDDFYLSIHDVLKTLIYVENLYIALLSEDGKTLDFPFYADSRLPKGESRKFGRGLTEYVINKGEACLINKAQADELVKQRVILRRQEDDCISSRLATSWLGAPLVINDKAIGVVTVQAYDDEYEYTDKELEVLCFVSNHLAVAIQRKLASDALKHSHDELESEVLTRTQELRQSNLFLKLQVEERKKAEQKLYFEANHDALTGLPNRKMILQRLEQAIADQKRHSEHHFAVLFIDLDRFKIINDTMGHHVGDQFLIEVSLRIASCIRENDILARLGGDEFVILLDMIQSLEDAEEIAQRIIMAVGSPFFINNQEIYSGASVGIAQCDASYTTADDLLRDADAAMYQAKGMGRGRFIVFDETMHQQLMEELNIDQALHRAVKEQGLMPLFNGVFNLESSQSLGFEAQVHWYHPDLGDVSAEYFAQLAQSSGLMEVIDQQILTHVCQQMKPRGRLSDAGLICVTLSESHLKQNKALQKLIEIVIEQKVDAHKLCFQFTEQSLLQLSDVQISGLKRIKQAGISVAISGFGSGVSSVGLLAHNSIDYVKIDEGFTKTLLASDKQQSLLDVLLQLSQTFDFKLILDGIHNQALVDLAVDKKVYLGLGKHFKQEVVAQMPFKPSLVLHKFA